MIRYRCRTPVNAVSCVQLATIYLSIKQHHLVPPSRDPLVLSTVRRTVTGLS
jgi:hypothetical protein